MKIELPRGVLVAGVVLLLFAGSLALLWPGVAMYDSIAQFDQALSGEYEDWHPPIMAHVWAALHAVFGGTSEPMLVLQMGLYWLGFGLIAATLARSEKPRASAAMLVIGMLPLFLGWQGVILKDAQMLGAMLAAVGIVIWWRSRVAPPFALLCVIVATLLVYATLIRANAVFATVPLTVMLFGPTHGWARLGACVVGTALVLAVAPLVNHGLLGAASSGVERTEAVYDLAGIAVRDPASSVGLTPDEARAIAAKHCVKALFWDPLGVATRCAPIVERFHTVPPRQMYRLLAQAVLRHPLDYAAHRLAHLNSTDRWLVPAAWPSAVPPAVSERNTLGLRSPGGAARAWQMLAKWVIETPLGWPVAWIVVAIAGLSAAARSSGRTGDLPTALLVSALTLEASFAVLSIASDLRYHLWPMVATALASVLLLMEGRLARRTLLLGGAALGAVIVSGTAARILLPSAPISYQAALQ